MEAVYDLSATPFFLKGSDCPKAPRFPWPASDFGLLDAIGSGIVKGPRLPVLDDSIQGDLPKFRNVCCHVAGGLPKKGRGKQVKAQTAEALYKHCTSIYEAWAAYENTQIAPEGNMAPATERSRPLVRTR